MAGERRRTKAEQSRHSRALLLAAARRAFRDQGFHAATTTIAAAAGLSRGALYHQFRDKEALFAAVVEELGVEIAAAIKARGSAPAGPWDDLEHRCLVFLDAALRPGARRIYWQDAPAILGWSAWRALDQRHGGGLIAQAVEACFEGHAAQSPAATALLVTGAVRELALSLAESPGNKSLRAVHERALIEMLRALKTQHVGHGIPTGVPAGDPGRRP